MIEATPAGAILDIRVVPRSGRSGIAGLRGGALLVRLAAAPVDGAANAELIEVLSAALGVPRRAVTIRSGLQSRTKRVEIVGKTAHELSTLLGL
jgi:uncharacterized protein